MVNLILLIFAVGLLVMGVVFVVDRFVAQKAKPWLIVFFGLLSLFLGYKIYQSVNAPIRFEAIKQQRYSQVIAKLKDISNAQEAYKSANGIYTGDFKALVRFIDTGRYTITQQRDSSFMQYDQRYQIDVQKDTVLIDTLGFVSVKDSLFGDSDRYKTLMEIPFAPHGEAFEMKAGVVEKKGYKVPVFQVRVEKNLILYDQPKDLVAREKTHVSVEEVNGSAITIGSLTEVNTKGNWPPVYDRKDR